jgi:hypothetical protein
MTELISYPEHEKLKKVRDKSQAIGEFLVWLQERYTLCSYLPVSTRLTEEGHIEIVEDERARHPFHVPVTKNIEDYLSDYFGIDQEKLEKEKRQALAALRQ